MMTSFQTGIQHFGLRIASSRKVGIPIRVEKKQVGIGFTAGQEGDICAQAAVCLLQAAENSFAGLFPRDSPFARLSWVDDHLSTV